MLRLSPLLTLLAAVVAGAAALSASVAPTAALSDPATSRDRARHQAAPVTRDVAITSVAKDGSPFAAVVAGTIITVNVVAQNLGTAAETFPVQLRDETDDVDIITVSVTLAAGEQVTLGLPWDTTGASYQDDAPPPDARPHNLKAEATLASDSDTSNNASSTGLEPGSAILIQKNPNAPAPPTNPQPTPTPAPRITFPDNLAVPQATYGDHIPLQNPPIATQGRPAPGFWVGPVDAQLAGHFSPPPSATAGQPQQQLFVAAAAARFQPGQALLNPFRQGEVVGRLRLQQRHSSLGAFLQAGTRRYFVQEDGTFRAPLPAGTQDLYLRAPGYLPVLLPQVTIDPGDRVTLPDLTLPFGDANGDGRIDILDLSIAASNFSSVAQELALP